jgi:anti-sigma B factor antagonist
MTLPILLTVGVRWDDLDATIALRGELDCATVPFAMEHVGKILEQSPATLVLDLAGLSFMDSHGMHLIRAILTTRQDIPAYRRLVLRSPTPLARRLLQLTGMEQGWVIE